MKSSEFLLLFFIIYSGIITILFLLIIYKLRKDNVKLDEYNEELNFELVKLRGKCYSKNKEE